MVGSLIFMGSLAHNYSVVKAIVTNSSNKTWLAYMYSDICMCVLYTYAIVKSLSVFLLFLMLGPRAVGMFPTSSWSAIVGFISFLLVYIKFHWQCLKCSGVNVRECVCLFSHISLLLCLRSVPTLSDSLPICEKGKNVWTLLDLSVGVLNCYLVSMWRGMPMHCGTAVWTGWTECILYA